MLEINPFHKYLAEIALLSYTGNFESLKVDASKVISYIGDALHKYIIEFDEYYVVAIRGSANGYDWRNNFTNLGWTDDFAHTNVHPGFMAELDADINPRLSFDKPVFLCGHSMGGACCLLYSFQLATLNQNITEVVTFGSPMPGALSFKEQIEAKLPGKITRYCNGDDVTPSLPPFKYYSPGKDISIGVKHSSWNPVKLFHLTSDHRMTEYIKSLEASDK